ncbi:MAG: tetratricopeptide repeat protein [Myxococcaceae bacterium]
MADKLTKKELRSPDAFQRAGAEATSWAGQHEKKLAGAVVVVLLVGGGIAVTRYLSSRTDHQASRALSEALKVLERPVTESPSSEDSKDLTPFRTEKEKSEAVVKTLAEFRSQYKGTQSAVTAALPYAQASLKLGNYDEALSAYQEVAKDIPATDPLHSTALEGTGYAYEAKGQLDQALSSFEQLSKENQSEFLNGMGLYHQARVLIQQNKKEEAVTRLSEISDKAPDSAAARMAKERLAILVSEGVKLPEKAPAPKTDAGP